MNGQPRCQKCGKRLTDPVSIACGLGPECRGGGAGHGKRFGMAQKRRQARAARTQAFASGQPVQIGVNTFEPVQTQNGLAYQRPGDKRPIPAAEFKTWLERYDFITHDSTPSGEQVAG
jgi:hypothetical protein